MRKLALLFIPALFVACEEKSLVEPKENPPEENVFLATSFVYNQEQFFPDSALTNNEGLKFFITDVQIVLSDFYFKQNDDTVLIEKEPIIVRYGSFDKPLVKLEPGGYSGFFGVRIGLDSLTSALITPSSLPPGNDLLDANVFRPDGKGVDNVVITGRLIDPSNPLDSVGTIPLEYRLGTAATSKLVISPQKNFSLVQTSQVRLIMQIDIGPVFEDFDMELRPNVTTNTNNQVDYNLALIMADSLQVGLF